MVMPRAKKVMEIARVEKKMVVEQRDEKIP